MEIEKLVEQITQEVSKRLAEHAPLDPAALASTIEHSLLNPDICLSGIKKGCEEARQYGFANVCVSPYYVSFAAQALKGSGVAVCAPVGFPQGAASTNAKCAEIREAIMNGATELDVCLMYTAIKSGDYGFVKKDLCEMVSVSGSRAKVKAIFEQGILTEEEKAKTLAIIAACGVDYVKISNALTGKKACVEDVKYVRAAIGSRIGIKIDGGIKDAATVQELLAAGAQRFGCSASVKIVTGQ